MVIVKFVERGEISIRNYATIVMSKGGCWQGKQYLGFEGAITLTLRVVEGVFQWFKSSSPMTKPGPKKTPAVIHKRRKTYRPGRHAEPAKQTKTRRTVPKPPAVLCKEAKSHWKTLAAGLVERNLLTDLDHPAFAIYCESLAEYWLHRGKLKKASDWLETTSNGNTIQNPRVGMMNRAAKKVQDFGARFGMTPSDRCGLAPNSPNDGADNSFMDFLNRSLRGSSN